LEESQRKKRIKKTNSDMKKYLFFPASTILASLSLWAQPDNSKYPEPEFNNEVYFLKKDSVKTVRRLEKGSSKMDTKTKLGGMAGAESGYTLKGERSTVRLRSGNDLSFIFSTGASVGASSTAQRDSIMLANGMDPAATQGMGSMTDPATSITLYKTESGKGVRKILMMKSPGMSPFASKKMKSSDKHTFSVRKIRVGYWELVIDKPLGKGEYAFSMMSMGAANMDGGTLLFAFAID
jgi:hypothetical protein